MRTMTFTLMALTLGLSGLPMLAWSHTDTVTSATSPSPSAHIEGELHQETAVSTSDPSLDALIARFAHLHRDVVGFSVSGPENNSVFATAAPSQPIQTATH